MLVVDGADAQARRAFVVQGEQAVVIAGAAFGRGVDLAAADAHQQGLARLQGAGDGPGVGRVEYVVGRGGQGPLGPNHHVRNRRARLGCQGHIAVDDGLIGFRTPFGLLRNVGLNQPHQGRPVHPLGRGQPEGSKGEQARQNDHAQTRRDQAVPARPGVNQQAQRRHGRQRHQPETIDARHGSELRHGRSRLPGGAGRVPGKARQDMAAQPFQQGEQGGE
ncbi:hypothetical protein D3C85_918190 [compost metagenome]